MPARTTSTAPKNVKRGGKAATSDNADVVTATTVAGADRPRMATVPDMTHFNSYISRKVSGGLSELDVFEKAQAQKWNVLIEGPTGPGKTSAVMAYAAKTKQAMYSIPSNVGIEPTQLFGKYRPAETEDEVVKANSLGLVWQDGPVTDLVRHGGVLLINEVNFLPERVATVLFGLMDKRRQIVLLDHRGEVIVAHENLFVVADMNPDYEGTRPLNKAFRNRFPIQLVFDYDTVVEKKLVPFPALRDFAGMVRGRPDEFETPLSTNMLMEFCKMAPVMGYGFAVDNFVNHYTPEERPSLKQVFDTMAVNIEADVDLAISKMNGQEVATPEGELEEGTPVNWDEYPEQWRGKVTSIDDPMWDFELGAYGTGWLYQDEDSSTGPTRMAAGWTYDALLECWVEAATGLTTGDIPTASKGGGTI
jgi:hypothetical protein